MHNSSKRLVDDISEIFKYGPCNIPSSLFDTISFLVNHKILWLQTSCGKIQLMWWQLTGSTENIQYVLNCGSLLRIPWQRGEIFPKLSKHTSLTYTNSTYLQLSYLMDIQSTRQQWIQSILGANVEFILWKLISLKKFHAKWKKDNFLANTTSNALSIRWLQG